MPYDNRNSFVLFKNDRKEEDKHPDYTGTFTDDQGREYFCDAWIKDGKGGKKFMSGRVKLKTGGAQRQKAQPAPTPPSGQDAEPDSIPF